MKAAVAWCTTNEGIAVFATGIELWLFGFRYGSGSKATHSEWRRLRLPGRVPGLVRQPNQNPQRGPTRGSGYESVGPRIGLGRVLRGRRVRFAGTGRVGKWPELSNELRSTSTIGRKSADERVAHWRKSRPRDPTPIVLSFCATPFPLAAVGG
jgi:hypothetical protein